MREKTRSAALLLAIVLFSAGAAATSFSGSGAHELMPGDSVVLENNSSITAGTITADYVYLEFFGAYKVRKLGLDLFAKDFEKQTRAEVVGLKFSAKPVYKAKDSYAVLLDASVLKANLALRAELKPRTGPAAGSVSAAGFVSRLSVENTGDLALDKINAVFALVRNGEDIFYSENNSAIERLAPGETAAIRIETASWPLIPTNPDKPTDNFSVRIVIARNQFEETDYSDNEILIPVDYAAPMPTPAATQAASATPTATTVAQTATPAPEAAETPAAGKTGADNALLYAGAIVFLAILAGAAFLVLRKPPANAPKPKKG